MPSEIMIASMLLAFAASMITLIGKEYFDRRRQRTNSINTLIVLVRMLKNAVEYPPELSSHISIEKVVAILPEVATDKKVRDSFLSFEAALRRYRFGWKCGSSPGQKEIEDIRSILNECEKALQ